MEPTPTWRARTTRVPRCAHHTRRMRNGSENLGSAAGRPRGLPAGRYRFDRPRSRHNVMAPAGHRSRRCGGRNRPGSPVVPLAGPSMASDPRQSRGSPTLPRCPWPLVERHSGTCCTYFRRERPVRAPSTSTRHPRVTAPTPQPKPLKGARRHSEAHARKRESHGTRPVRRAGTRTRRLRFLEVVSRSQATLRRRPLVATGSPPMPTTGDSGGPVAPGRESPRLPISRRSGEGGGPGPRRCRDRGPAVNPASAVHAPSPSLPGLGRCVHPTGKTAGLAARAGHGRDARCGGLVLVVTAPSLPIEWRTLFRDSSRNSRWPATAGHRLVLLGFLSTFFTFLFR